jgi:hypothetical protein
LLRPDAVVLRCFDLSRRFLAKRTLLVAPAFFE